MSNIKKKKSTSNRIDTHESETIEKKTQNRSKKKAATFPELLVVLGIISTVLVASITTLIRATSDIRDNDIEETATFLLLRGHEIAKSPQAVQVDTVPQSESLYAMRVNEFDEFSLDWVTHDTSEDFQRQATPECTAISDYYVSNQLAETTAVPYCVQIKFTELPTNDTGAVYRTHTTIVYRSSEGIQQQSLEGYRYQQLQQRD